MEKTPPRFRFQSPILKGLLGLVCLWLMGCEKDDICVDGDTPLLVVQFFDQAETETPKAVERLRVIGLGNGSPVPTFADRSNLDSIALPLRAGEEETTFVLIRDSRDEEGVDIGNPDTLRLTYETLGSFVSRACGFVANYENLSGTLQPDTANWILNIEVDTTSVQSQEIRHVSIFH